MIVKRLEKNGKIKAMYSSSTICGSIYDTTTKELTVIFNNGGQYKYADVAASDYMRFETADSNGTIFNTYIKKKYMTYQKLDNLNEASLASLLKEVEQLKTVEEKSKEEVKNSLSNDDIGKKMLESMIDLLGSYVATGKVDYELLRKVETKIVEYNKVANQEPTSANNKTIESYE